MSETVSAEGTVAAAADRRPELRVVGHRHRGQREGRRHGDGGPGARDDRLGRARSPRSPRPRPTVADAQAKLVRRPGARARPTRRSPPTSRASRRRTTRSTEREGGARRARRSSRPSTAPSPSVDHHRRRAARRAAAPAAPTPPAPAAGPGSRRPTLGSSNGRAAAATLERPARQRQLDRADPGGEHRPLHRRARRRQRRHRQRRGRADRHGDPLDVERRRPARVRAAAGFAGVLRPAADRRRRHRHGGAGPAAGANARSGAAPARGDRRPRRATGTVTAVGKVADASSGVATYPVTISLRRHRHRLLRRVDGHR